MCLPLLNLTPLFSTKKKKKNNPNSAQNFDIMPKFCKNSARNLHTLDIFWRVISYNCITYNSLFETNQTELVEVHQQILKGDKNVHSLMSRTGI